METNLIKIRNQPTTNQFLF